MKYSIDIENDDAGKRYFDQDTWNESKPIIEKAIKTAFRNGFIPRVDEMVYGDDDLYYVSFVCYSEKRVTIWLSIYDKKERKELDK